MDNEILKGKICSFNLRNSNQKAKKHIFYAFIFTLLTMIVEIVAGSIYHSMALLADGWHMSSHTLALGLALLAYIVANHYEKDIRFTFGTYKVEILAAFVSAIFLLGVAFFMAYESVERLIKPETIAYKEAIIVAFLGLFINGVCVWLLRDDESMHAGHSHGAHSHEKHTHGHSHSHFLGGNGENCGGGAHLGAQTCAKNSHDSCDEHSHEGHLHEKDLHGNSAHAKAHAKQDLNLKAAYVHVLADALTSVFAIIALFGGLFFNFWWLDSLMGIVGAVLVFVWALNLLKQSAKILLDISGDEGIYAEISALLKDRGEIKDLHLLRVGKDEFALILSLPNHADIKEIRKSLKTCKQLVHVSIEVLD